MSFGKPDLGKWLGTIKMYTYVYASKSPVLIDSINCSVILIISCRRAAKKEKTIISPIIKTFSNLVLHNEHNIYKGNTTTAYSTKYHWFIREEYCKSRNFKVNKNVACKVILDYLEKVNIGPWLIKNHCHW